MMSFYDGKMKLHSSLNDCLVSIYLVKFDCDESNAVY